MLSIFNSSLSSGCVPDYFRTACVQPTLKKPGLDPTLLDNDCLVSKLPFFAKILEEITSKQLLTVVKKNSI